MSGKDIEVSGPGVAQLQRKINALDRAARGELDAELLAGLQAGSKPLVPLVRAEAQAGGSIPRSGGLSQRVARLPMHVDSAVAGRNVGVKFVVDGELAVKTNSGYVDHPVFNTGTSVRQPITPGWFDKVLEKESPRVIPPLRAAMARVAAKIRRA